MTSAVLAASTSSAWVIGVSSALRRASNNSRMRISTLSGSLRVTTTSGFLLVAINCLLRQELNDHGHNSMTPKSTSLQFSLYPTNDPWQRPLATGLSLQQARPLPAPHQRFRRPVQVSLTRLA